MISLSKESKPNYLKTKLLEPTGQLTSTWIEDLKPIVKPTNLMSKIPISLSSLPNIRLQLLTFIAVKLQRKLLRLSKYLLSLKESLSTTWHLMRKQRNWDKKLRNHHQNLKKKRRKSYQNEKSTKKKRSKLWKINTLIKDLRKLKSKNESFLTLDLSQ